MNSNERITQMQTKLTQALAPTHLEIIDDSHKHHGHIGSKGGGHFTVMIAAPNFKNKSLVECHRMVYTALGDMMETEIHALKIQIVK